MKKLMIAIVAALPFLPADTASAQQLDVGTWTGTVTHPNGRVENVTFDVTMKNDTLGIAANVDGGAQVVVFRDPKLDGATLTFSFPAPSPVQCTLTRRDDNAYEGPCRAPEATRGGVLLMVPPKKEQPE